MWDALLKINTPLVLSSFVLSVAMSFALAAIRAHLKRKSDLVRLASPEDRPQLVEDAIHDLKFPVENLTRDQRYRLVLTILNRRRHGFTLSVTVFLVISILLLA